MDCRAVLLGQPHVIRHSGCRGTTALQTTNHKALRHASGGLSLIIYFEKSLEFFFNKLSYNKIIF